MVFTEELNLFLPCFGLSASYSTRAYTETSDPVRQPGIPQPSYTGMDGTAGVQLGSI